MPDLMADFDVFGTIAAYAGEIGCSGRRDIGVGWMFGLIAYPIFLLALLPPMDAPQYDDLGH